MKLYVGNLSETATEQDIKEHFGKYGAGNVKIIKDYATGKSKGFCFIDMPEEGVQRAIAELNNTEFMGATITVNYAERSEKRKVQKDSWKYKYLSDVKRH